MATRLESLRAALEADEPTGEFKPYCVARKESDALTFYFRPDRDYSKRLTDHVTLLLSVDTDEIVGCRVKGISAILEDLPNYIEVTCNEVDLSILFFSFRGTAEDEVVRQALNDLGRAAAGRKFNLARMTDSGSGFA